MTHKLLNNRKSWIAIFHDCLMAFLSLPIALYLRVGDDIFLYSFSSSLPRNIAIFLGISMFVFLGSGLYRGIWRYASHEDLIAITRSVTVTIILFMITLFFIDRLSSYPRSLPIIHWLVLTVMIGAPRFVYKTIRDKYNHRFLKRTESKMKVPILLFGSDDQADSFIREIKRNPLSSYKIIGIVDKNKKRVGRRIHEVEILGSIDALESIFANLANTKQKPTHLVVTYKNSEIDSNTYKRLLRICSKNAIKLSRIPDITELKSSDIYKIELKPINLEDLLGRPQTSLDKDTMKKFIEGKNVLITGAGGSIGSELTRQIIGFTPSNLTIIDHAEYNLYNISEEIHSKTTNISVRSFLCDVRHKLKLEKIIKEEKPDIVFHAAALKHVHIVEQEVEEGILTNVQGTKNVADLCLKHKVKTMVMISTDKAVKPQSVMGATKRLAESYCQALDIMPSCTTKFVTVRFGNVLGSSGSVIPLFKKQLEEGGPLTVTHPEATRYFMTIREAVELVLQASAFAQVNDLLDDGKLFVLDMGEPVLIKDLARQIIRLAGLSPDKDIDIKYVGLRPGERLHEILLHEHEKLQPTKINGLLIASPRISEYKILEKALSELFKYAENCHHTRALNQLEQLVPEFTLQKNEKTSIKEKIYDKKSL